MRPRGWSESRRPAISVATALERLDRRAPLNRSRSPAQLQLTKVLDPASTRRGGSASHQRQADPLGQLDAVRDAHVDA